MTPGGTAGPPAKKSKGAGPEQRPGVASSSTQASGSGATFPYPWHNAPTLPAAQPKTATAPPPPAALPKRPWRASAPPKANPVAPTGAMQVDASAAGSQDAEPPRTPATDDKVDRALALHVEAREKAMSPDPLREAQSGGAVH